MQTKVNGCIYLFVKKKLLHNHCLIYHTDIEGNINVCICIENIDITSCVNSHPWPNKELNSA